MKSFLIKITLFSILATSTINYNTKAMGFFSKDPKQKEAELSKNIKTITEEIIGIRNYIQQTENINTAKLSDLEKKLKTLKTEYFKKRKELKEVQKTLRGKKASKARLRLEENKNKTLAQMKEERESRRKKNKSKIEKARIIKQSREEKELLSTLETTIAREFKSTLTELTNINDIKRIVETRLDSIVPKIIDAIILETQISENPNHKIINNIAKNIKALWLVAKKRLNNINIQIPETAARKRKKEKAFNICEEENALLLERLEELVKPVVKENISILEDYLISLDIELLKTNSEALAFAINEMLNILIFNSFELLENIGENILIDWIMVQKDKMLLPGAIDNTFVISIARDAIKNYVKESLDNLLILVEEKRNFITDPRVLTYIQKNILSAIDIQD